MVLGIDCTRHVITDHAEMPAGDRHGACIWICFQDLGGACPVHLGLDLSEFVCLLLELRNFVEDTLDLRVADRHAGCRVYSVCAIQFRQIALNALVDLLEALAQFLARKILTPLRSPP